MVFYFNEELQIKLMKSIIDFNFGNEYIGAEGLGVH